MTADDLLELLLRTHLTTAKHFYDNIMGSTIWVLPVLTTIRTDDVDLPTYKSRLKPNNAKDSRGRLYIVTNTQTKTSFTYLAQSLLLVRTDCTDKTLLTDFRPPDKDTRYLTTYYKQPDMLNKKRHTTDITVNKTIY